VYSDGNEEGMEKKKGEESVKNNTCKKTTAVARFTALFRTKLTRK